MTNDNETPVPHVDRETASKLNRFIEASTEDGLLAVSTPEEPPIEEPSPEHHLTVAEYRAGELLRELNRQGLYGKGKKKSLTHF